MICCVICTKDEVLLTKNNERYELVFDCQRENESEFDVISRIYKEKYDIQPCNVKFSGQVKIKSKEKVTLVIMVYKTEENKSKKEGFKWFNKWLCPEMMYNSNRWIPMVVSDYSKFDCNYNE